MFHFVLVSLFLYQIDQMLEFFSCLIYLVDMTINTYSLLHVHFPLKSIFGKKTGLLLTKW